MLHKPTSTDHSPAHSHPRTQCWKACSSPRKYISDSRASSSFSKLKTIGKYSSNSGSFPDDQVIKKKLFQLSPFQTSFASKSTDTNKPCCRRLPKFSIDVSRNNSAIQLPPVDIIWSESSLSSKTRKSLRHQSLLPIPDHQTIKVIYHGFSSGSPTVLFVAS